MRPVRIVTDSTADIPDDLVRELKIGIVYDYVNFGDQSLQDRIDISRQEFYTRLSDSSQAPTTAAPGIGEFEQAFRNAGAPEVDVVSLHPPVGISGLYNAARLAAQSFPEGRVTVVDTAQLSMGMGWQVIAAARAAQEGASVQEIVAKVAAMRPRVRVFAALDTIEFLRRSGRVSWAQAIVGTLLNIKPMLEVREGEVLPLDRVRTRRRAMTRLVALAESLGPLESLAALHTNQPDGADELRRRLAHLRPSGQDEILTINVTPIIGVHTGPRGLGIAAVIAAH
jgi:DegV family protein with EDD domain